MEIDEAKHLRADASVPFVAVPRNGWHTAKEAVGYGVAAAEVVGIDGDIALLNGAHISCIIERWHDLDVFRAELLTKVASEWDPIAGSVQRIAHEKAELDGSVAAINELAQGLHVAVVDFLTPAKGIEDERRTGSGGFLEPPEGVQRHVMHHAHAGK